MKDHANLAKTAQPGRLAELSTFAGGKPTDV
jgi:hypothetical protein